jgi:steroid Delta-isomerase
VDPSRESFADTCKRIFHAWDAAARAGDAQALAALYAEDCRFESALVPVILPGRRGGVLHGKADLLDFLTRAAANRPDEVLKWHRSDSWLSDGKRILAWEYPRLTPDGEQSDVAEFMEIENGLIAVHRVYWGWKSALMLAPSLARVEGGGEPGWTNE